MPHYRRGNLVVRTFTLQSVDLGSIALSSLTKTKIGIYRFPAWHSAAGVIWRVKDETEFTEL